MVWAQHAREPCAHVVNLHAGDVHIHALWNAAHEVARTAARLQDLSRALIADTGAPQRLPDKLRDGTWGVEGRKDRGALLCELILTKQLFQLLRYGGPAAGRILRKGVRGAAPTGVGRNRTRLLGSRLSSLVNSRFEGAKRSYVELRALQGRMAGLGIRVQVFVVVGCG